MAAKKKTERLARVRNETDGAPPFPALIGIDPAAGFQKSPVKPWARA
jgi:hypothetical protein